MARMTRAQSATVKHDTIRRIQRLDRAFASGGIAWAFSDADVEYHALRTVVRACFPGRQNDYNLRAELDRATAALCRAIRRAR